MVRWKQWHLSGFSKGSCPSVNLEIGVHYITPYRGYVLLPGSLDFFVTSLNGEKTLNIRIADILEDGYLLEAVTAGGEVKARAQLYVGNGLVELKVCKTLCFKLNLKEFELSSPIKHYKSSWKKNKATNFERNKAEIRWERTNRHNPKPFKKGKEFKADLICQLGDIRVLPSNNRVPKLLDLYNKYFKCDELCNILSIMNELAKAYLESGELNDAEKWCLDAIERAESFLKTKYKKEARRNRGFSYGILVKIYLKGNKLDKALEAAKQFVTLYENIPVAYGQLWDVHMARGEYEEALKAAQNYIRLDPDNPIGYAKQRKALKALRNKSKKDKRKRISSGCMAISQDVFGQWQDRVGLMIDRPQPQTIAGGPYIFGNDIVFIYLPKNKNEIVQLAASFVKPTWEPSPMQLETTKKGKDYFYFKMRVKAGTYQYKFVVNGTWKLDPANPSKLTDSSNNENSLVEVRKINGRFLLLKPGRHLLTPQITGNRVEFIYVPQEGKLPQSVKIVSSLNSYQHQEMQMRNFDGSPYFYTSILAKCGLHKYKFVVDGEWQRDYMNPYVSEDTNLDSLVCIGRLEDGFYRFFKPGRFTAGPQVIDNKVIFIYHHKGTNKPAVELAVEFNGWEKQKMSRIELGNNECYYYIETTPLPGLFEYKFVVDNVYVQDDSHVFVKEGIYKNSLVRIGKRANGSFILLKPEQSFLAPHIFGGMIHFVYKHRGRLPPCGIVKFNSKLTNWKQQDMELVYLGAGQYCWMISFSAQAGYFPYGFIVDGAWILDSNNPYIEVTAQGYRNSVICLECGKYVDYVFVEPGRRNLGFIAGFSLAEYGTVLNSDAAAARSGRIVKRVDPYKAVREVKEEAKELKACFAYVTSYVRWFQLCSWVSRLLHGNWDVTVGQKSDKKNIKKFIAEKIKSFGYNDIEVVAAEVLDDYYVQATFKTGQAAISVELGYDTNKIEYKINGVKVKYYQDYGSLFSLPVLCPEAHFADPFTEEIVSGGIRDLYRMGTLPIIDFSPWYSPEILLYNPAAYRYFIHEVFEETKSDEEIRRQMQTRGVILRYNGKAIFVKLRGDAQDQLMPNIEAKTDEGQFFWEELFFARGKWYIDHFFGLAGFRVDFVHWLGNNNNFEVIHRAFERIRKYAEQLRSQKVYFLLECHDELDGSDNRKTFRQWNDSLDNPVYITYYTDVIKALTQGDKKLQRLVGSLRWLAQGGKCIDLMILFQYDDEPAVVVFHDKYGFGAPPYREEKYQRRTFMKWQFMTAKAGGNIFVLMYRDLKELVGGFFIESGGRKEIKEKEENTYDWQTHQLPTAWEREVRQKKSQLDLFKECYNSGLIKRLPSVKGVYVCYEEGQDVATVVFELEQGRRMEFLFRENWGEYGTYITIEEKASSSIRMLRGVDIPKNYSSEGAWEMFVKAVIDAGAREYFKEYFRGKHFPVCIIKRRGLKTVFDGDWHTIGFPHIVPLYAGCVGPYGFGLEKIKQIILKRYRQDGENYFGVIEDGRIKDLGEDTIIKSVRRIMERGQLLRGPTESKTRHALVRGDGWAQMVSFEEKEGIIAAFDLPENEMAGQIIFSCHLLGGNEKSHWTMKKLVNIFRGKERLIIRRFVGTQENRIRCMVKGVGRYAKRRILYKEKDKNIVFAVAFKSKRVIVLGCEGNFLSDRKIYPNEFNRDNCKDLTDLIMDDVLPKEIILDLDASASPMERICEPFYPVCYSMEAWKRLFNGMYEGGIINERFLRRKDRDWYIPFVVGGRDGISIELKEIIITNTTCLYRGYSKESTVGLNKPFGWVFLRDNNIGYVREIINGVVTPKKEVVEVIKKGKGYFGVRFEEKTNQIVVSEIDGLLEIFRVLNEGNDFAFRGIGWSNTIIFREDNNMISMIVLHRTRGVDGTYYFPKEEFATHVLFRCGEFEMANLNLDIKIHNIENTLNIFRGKKRFLISRKCKHPGEYKYVLDEILESKYIREKIKIYIQKKYRNGQLCLDFVIYAEVRDDGNHNYLFTMLRRLKRSPYLKEYKVKIVVNLCGYLVYFYDKPDLTPDEFNGKGYYDITPLIKNNELPQCLWVHRPKISDANRQNLDGSLISLKPLRYKLELRQASPLGKRLDFDFSQEDVKQVVIKLENFNIGQYELMRELGYPGAYMTFNRELREKILKGTLWPQARRQWRLEYKEQYNKEVFDKLVSMPFVDQEGFIKALGCKCYVEVFLKWLEDELGFKQWYKMTARAFVKSLKDFLSDKLVSEKYFIDDDGSRKTVTLKRVYKWYKDKGMYNSQIGPFYELVLGKFELMNTSLKAICAEVMAQKTKTVSASPLKGIDKFGTPAFFDFMKKQHQATLDIDKAAIKIPINEDDVKGVVEEWVMGTFNAKWADEFGRLLDSKELRYMNMNELSKAVTAKLGALSGKPQDLVELKEAIINFLSDVIVDNLEYYCVTDLWESIRCDTTNCYGYALWFVSLARFFGINADIVNIPNVGGNIEYLESGRTDFVGFNFHFGVIVERIKEEWELLKDLVVYSFEKKSSIVNNTVITHKICVQDSKGKILYIDVGDLGRYGLEIKGMGDLEDLLFDFMRSQVNSKEVKSIHTLPLRRVVKEDIPKWDDKICQNWTELSGMSSVYLGIAQDYISNEDIAALKKEERNDPDNKFILTVLATGYFRRQDYHQALRYAMEALNQGSISEQLVKILLHFFVRPSREVISNQALLDTVLRFESLIRFRCPGGEEVLDKVFYWIKNVKGISTASPIGLDAIEVSRSIYEDQDGLFSYKDRSEIEAAFKAVQNGCVKSVLGRVVILIKGGEFFDKLAKRFKTPWPGYAMAVNLCIYEEIITVVINRDKLGTGFVRNNPRFVFDYTTGEEKEFLEGVFEYELISRVWHILYLVAFEAGYFNNSSFRNLIDNIPPQNLDKIVQEVQKNIETGAEYFSSRYGKYSPAGIIGETIACCLVNSKRGRETYLDESIRRKASSKKKSLFTVVRNNVADIGTIFEEINGIIDPYKREILEYIEETAKTSRVFRLAQVFGQETSENIAPAENKEPYVMLRDNYNKYPHLLPLLMVTAADLYNTKKDEAFRTLFTRLCGCRGEGEDIDTDKGWQKLYSVLEGKYPEVIRHIESSRPATAVFMLSIANELFYQALLFCKNVSKIEQINNADLTDSDLKFVPSDILTNQAFSTMRKRDSLFYMVNYLTHLTLIELGPKPFNLPQGVERIEFLIKTSFKLLIYKAIDLFCLGELSCAEVLALLTVLQPAYQSHPEKLYEKIPEFDKKLRAAFGMLSSHIKDKRITIAPFIKYELGIESCFPVQGGSIFWHTAAGLLSERLPVSALEVIFSRGLELNLAISDMLPEVDKALEEISQESQDIIEDINQMDFLRRINIIDFNGFIRTLDEQIKQKIYIVVAFALMKSRCHKLPLPEIAIEIGLLLLEYVNKEEIQLEPRVELDKEGGHKFIDCSLIHINIGSSKMRINIEGNNKHLQQINAGNFIFYFSDSGKIEKIVNVDIIDDGDDIYDELSFYRKGDKLEFFCNRIKFIKFCGQKPVEIAILHGTLRDRVIRQLNSHISSNKFKKYIRSLQYKDVVAESGRVNNEKVVIKAAKRQLTDEDKEKLDYEISSHPVFSDSRESGEKNHAKWKELIIKEIHEKFFKKQIKESEAAILRYIVEKVLVICEDGIPDGKIVMFSFDVPKGEIVAYRQLGGVAGLEILFQIQDGEYKFVGARVVPLRSNYTFSSPLSLPVCTAANEKVTELSSSSPTQNTDELVQRILDEWKHIIGHEAGHPISEIIPKFYWFETKLPYLWGDIKIIQEVFNKFYNLYFSLNKACDEKDMDTAAFYAKILIKILPETYKTLLELLGFFNDNEEFKTAEYMQNKQKRSFIEEVEIICALFKSIMNIFHCSLESSKKIEIDVKIVLKRILKLYGDEFSGITISRQFANYLPWVLAVPTDLHEVFLNLLINAKHALENTFAGGIKIETKTDDSRNNVIVTIGDDGCGISEENLPKIFDEYFTTKPSGKGSGLGLPIVKEIVEKYRGSIGVKSVVGQGTEFTVALPAIKKDKVNQSSPTKSASPVQVDIPFSDSEQALLDNLREIVNKALIIITDSQNLKVLVSQIAVCSKKEEPSSEINIVWKKIDLKNLDRKKICESLVSEMADGYRQEQLSLIRDKAAEISKVWKEMELVNLNKNSFFINRSCKYIMSTVDDCCDGIFQETQEIFNIIIECAECIIEDVIRIYIDIGINYLDKKELVKSEFIFTLAYGVNPDNIAVCSLLTNVYYALGKFAPAMDMCQRIRKMDPKDIYNCMEICILYIKMGEFDKAYEELINIRQLHNEKLKMFFASNNYKEVCEELNIMGIFCINVVNLTQEGLIKGICYCCLADNHYLSAVISLRELKECVSHSLITNFYLNDFMCNYGQSIFYWALSRSYGFNVYKEGLFTRLDPKTKQAITEEVAFHTGMIFYAEGYSYLRSVNIFGTEGIRLFEVYFKIAESCWEETLSDSSPVGVNTLSFSRTQTFEQKGGFPVVANAPPPAPVTSYLPLIPPVSKSSTPVKNNNDVCSSPLKRIFPDSFYEIVCAMHKVTKDLDMFAVSIEDAEIPELIDDAVNKWFNQIEVESKHKLVSAVVDNTNLEEGEIESMPLDEFAQHVRNVLGKLAAGDKFEQLQKTIFEFASDLSICSIPYDMPSDFVESAKGMETNCFFYVLWAKAFSELFGGKADMVYLPNVSGYCEKTTDTGVLWQFLRYHFGLIGKIGNKVKLLDDLVIRYYRYKNILVNDFITINRALVLVEKESNIWKLKCIDIGELGDFAADKLKGIGSCKSLLLDFWRHQLTIRNFKTDCNTKANIKRIIELFEKRKWVTAFGFSLAKIFYLCRDVIRLEGDKLFDMQCWCLTWVAKYDLLNPEIYHRFSQVYYNAQRTEEAFVHSLLAAKLGCRNKTMAKFAVFCCLYYDKLIKLGFEEKDLIEYLQSLKSTMVYYFGEEYTQDLLNEVPNFSEETASPVVVKLFKAINFRRQIRPLLEGKGVYGERFLGRFAGNWPVVREAFSGAKINKLLYLQIDICDWCDMYCVWCCGYEDSVRHKCKEGSLEEAREKLFMTKQQLYKLIGDLVKMGFYPPIRICAENGEPLGSKVTLEVIKKLAEIGFEVSIVINGKYMDEKTWVPLAQYCSQVVVSLDAGRESFRKVKLGADDSTFDTIIQNLEGLIK
ncbi:MAG: GHKL domain-containing protein, partial [Candidatus Omnitrophota bacterium]